MWGKILYGLFLIILLLASVKFTHFLMKRVKLNRWLIGIAAFLILIVPNIVFDKIPSLAANIISIIFAVLCIMFFEITRNMLEKEEHRGVVKTRASSKK